MSDPAANHLACVTCPSNEAGLCRAVTRNEVRQILFRSHGLGCPLGKFAAFRVLVPANPLRDLPLAGDELAAAIQRWGLDRLTEWWTKFTGKPCGCDSRRKWLNRLHDRLRHHFRKGRESGVRARESKPLTSDLLTSDV